MQSETMRRAFPSLYPHDRKYAMAHGEVAQSVASFKLNIACKEAIEKAIREGYDGMRLSGDAAKGVLAEFGAERVSCVLAATLQAKSQDGRFSKSNQDWAKTVPMPDAAGDRPPYTVQSHPGLVNIFVACARGEMKAAREQPEKKPSIRAQLAKKPEQEQKPRDTQVTEQMKKMGEAML